MKIAAVLLAAGQSSRFGAPKLFAELAGLPLALHAANNIASLPFEPRIAVVGPGTPPLSAIGFEAVTLEPFGAPLARSLQVGVERALADGATAVMVALADMPLVPDSHFTALLTAFDGNGIATRAAGISMPPALFGGALLQNLREGAGDQGGRNLLRDLPWMDLAAELAIDIDTPADLARAEAILAN